MLAGSQKSKVEEFYMLEIGIGGVKSPKIRGVKILNFHGGPEI